MVRLNEKYAELLGKLATLMMKTGEPFKARAYQKAQETVLQYPGDILSAEQLRGKPGFGETIMNKLEEFDRTGTLALIEREKTNPAILFADVYGIGPKKADELVSAGMKTIADLRENQDRLLNTIQKAGLKYYEDILERIPRSEIDLYQELFAKTFRKTTKHWEGEKAFEIVGSYRRGLAASGDIDVIITSDNPQIFRDFIDRLIQTGVIVEVLSRGSTKCLVIAKLPDAKFARRVDFLYTTPAEYPFSVLYFTGSKGFNTVMRGRALSLGYSLNEHGLSKMVDKKKTEPVDHVFRNEKDIFDFLKMRYQSPANRVDGRAVIALPNSPPVVQPIVKYGKQVIIRAADRKKTVSIAPTLPKNRTKKLNPEERAANIAAKAAAKAAKDTEKAVKDAEKAAAKIEKDAAKIAAKIEGNAAKVAARIAAKTEKIKLKIKSVAKTEKLKKEIKKPVLAAKKEIKISPKNITKKMKKSKACPPCPPQKDSTIMHTLQHFKENGPSILDTLTEETLNQMIIETNQAYYNDNPFLSDNEYDILKEYIERKFPKNTVIREVGAPVERNKAKLPYEMPSMDKIKPDTSALITWKQTHTGPYVMSCKLDGVSGLYTTEGDVPKLYTRGNGSVGQDVSHLIPYLKLPTVRGIVIRGEFIMPRDVFETKYKATFANPRNLVAGIVNRQTMDEKVRDLHFVAYEVIRPELKPSEQMMELLKVGVETVQHTVLANITNESLSDILVDWRAHYMYETDGVIVANDKIYPRESGNPVHAFAFKMVLSEQMAEAKVLDVVWTASKDGYLKPRVQIEPIQLGGVRIEWAIGFNAAFIETNRIGMGALIQIIRSGDVIPYIKAVITPAEHGKMPAVEYTWNDTHIDIVLLDKESDSTVRIKNIAGFFKDIEVDGLGEKNIERIIAVGFDSIPKIVHMTKEDFLTIDGFKEKMAVKLFQGIREKLDKASLVTLMAASNYFGRGFGERKIGPILDAYPNVLVDAVPESEKIKRIAAIKGMAKKTAESFVEKIPAFLGLMGECGLESKYMTNAPVILASVDTEHVLYQKTVVLSGTRDKAVIDALKRVGATIGSSVSKKTFAIVTDDKTSTTGKVETARSLNVPIFEPVEFMAKYF